MTPSIKWTRLLLIATLAAGAAAPVRAATHDGRWSVLVITEQGTCDKAYRYEVAVDGGRIRYAGPENVDFSGNVAANGADAVKVNIRLGEQGANGAGKLSASTGAGTWKGTGNSGSCAGRWEAERR